MLKLIKRLLRFRGREITIVVLDNREPELTDSFRADTRQLLQVAGVLLLVSVLLTTLVFYITPLGGIYVQSRDSGIRNDMLQITEHVIALEDSLERRDRQLTDLKQILIQVPDTLFPVSVQDESNLARETSEGSTGTTISIPRITREDLELVGREITRPAFPAPWPVDGTVSQRFDREERHIGLDISAPAGSEFRAIADGVVLSAEWTVPYGYVLYLQHRDGYVSVYKHGSRLFRETGESVIRGEVLGAIGDMGALSYGSHLHFELWRDGEVHPPQNFLSNGE